MARPETPATVIALARCRNSRRSMASVAILVVEIEYALVYFHLRDALRASACSPVMARSSVGVKRLSLDATV